MYVIGVWEEEWEEAVSRKKDIHMRLCVGVELWGIRGGMKA